MAYLATVLAHFLTDGLALVAAEAVDVADVCYQ